MKQIYERAILFGSCVGLMWKGELVSSFWNGFCVAVRLSFPFGFQRSPKIQRANERISVWLVSFRCRSKAFPKRTYHTQFTTMRLDRIVEMRTHFNLATICNLYDNVHFDVELAVNTCKTITATISKCAEQSRVKSIAFSFILHPGDVDVVCLWYKPDKTCMKVK